jgi:plastocyanin
MRNHVRLAAILMGIAIAAVACGNDEEVTVPRGPVSTSPPTAAAPVKLSGEVNNHGKQSIAGKDEVRLEADDFYFEPTFLGATPSQVVTVEIENEGQNAHTFTITSLDIDEVIQPGGDAKIEVKLPKSGVVNFFCRFHVSQGMQGAFYFPGSSSSSSSPSGATPSAATGGGGSSY